MPRPSFYFIIFQAHLYEGYKYTGERTLEGLSKFVLSNVKVNIKELNSNNWKEANKQQWLLFLCADSDMCEEESTMKKLAASLVIKLL